MKESREQWRKRLIRALEEDDVVEKNYHIRQMLQLCDTANMPAGAEERRESPKQ